MTRHAVIVAQVVSLLPDGVDVECEAREATRPWCAT